MPGGISAIFLCSKYRSSVPVIPDFSISAIFATSPASVTPESSTRSIQKEAVARRSSIRLALSRSPAFATPPSREGFGFDGEPEASFPALGLYGPLFLLVFAVLSAFSMALSCANFSAILSALAEGAGILFVISANSLTTVEFMSGSLSYSQKLKLIRPYTKLEIKQRVNFNSSQKALITRYFKNSISKGLIHFDIDEKAYTPNTKFVKSKVKKDGKKWRGYVVKGAKVGDKVRNGKIIKDNFEKIFIPIEFDDIPLDDESDTRKFVAEKTNEALEEYKDELTAADYFTISISLGYEIGQNQQGRTSFKKRRDGTKYTKGINTTKTKIERLIDALSENIFALLTSNNSKYAPLVALVGSSIISGVYLYKFTNQRKPNSKELKVIKRHRKKKK